MTLDQAAAQISQLEQDVANLQDLTRRQQESIRSLKSGMDVAFNLITDALDEAAEALHYAQQ